MLKTSIRTASNFSKNKKQSGVKYATKPHYSNEGIRSFDKNLPFSKEKTKPWEKQNITKDEFFVRKYGSISQEERQKLNEKVERQRRARIARKQTEYENRNYDNRSRHSISSFAQAFKNPLNEYLFGTHPVRAALTANKRESFNKLFVHNSKDSEILKLAKKYGLKIVKKESKGDLNSLSDNGVHNGVVLETKPLQLPIITSLTECNPESGEYKLTIFNDLYNTEVEKVDVTVREFKDNSAKKYPLGIYLDGITDPQNVGAIVRSAFYLGADFIVVPEHETARLGPAANKASSGAIELMTIYQTEDSFEFVESIKKNGWNVISTSAKPNEDEKVNLHSKHEKVEQHLTKKFIDSSELSNIMSESPILLIMGSEGAGVRTNLKIKSDYLVGLSKGRQSKDTIVDSLNVSVAAGLLIEKCFA